jgi:hypothetical protein|tara:strand:+ start:566 stop:775 length:210 start_codon:yes stop_codon:yes gene_type:complete
MAELTSFSYFAISEKVVESDEGGKSVKETLKDLGEDVKETGSSKWVWIIVIIVFVLVAVGLKSRSGKKK